MRFQNYNNNLKNLMCLITVDDSVTTNLRGLLDFLPYSWEKKPDCVYARMQSLFNAIMITDCWVNLYIMLV